MFAIDNKYVVKLRCPEDNYMECLPWKECSLVIPPFKKGLVLTAAFYLFTVMLFPIVIYSMIFYKVVGIFFTTYLSIFKV